MTEQELILRLEHGWVSRQEVATMLGCSDRKARSYIEELNQQLKQYGKCILSTSSRNGYHIPDHNSEEDRMLVERAIAELKSKAVSIFEHRQALEEFLRYEKSKSTQQQISLFDL